MPELPEVEVTRAGISAPLLGRAVSRLVLRRGDLRHPFPDDLEAKLVDRRLHAVRRRGKYLLLDFATGTLIFHLGMSGTLRVLPAGTPAAKHDHVDIVFGEALVHGCAQDGISPCP